MSILGDFQKKRSSPKFKGFLRPKSKLQRVFLAKTCDLQKKKKKGYHRLWVSFKPKNSTILVQTTASSSQLRLPHPEGGGLFSFLEQKSASKAQRSAILHTFQANEGEGARAPHSYAIEPSAV